MATIHICDVCKDQSVPVTYAYQIPSGWVSAELRIFRKTKALSICEKCKEKLKLNDDYTDTAVDGFIEYLAELVKERL